MQLEIIQNICKIMIPRLNVLCHTAEYCRRRSQMGICHDQLLKTRQNQSCFNIIIVCVFVSTMYNSNKEGSLMHRQHLHPYCAKNYDWKCTLFPSTRLIFTFWYWKRLHFPSFYMVFTVQFYYPRMKKVKSIITNINHVFVCH